MKAQTLRAAHARVAALKRHQPIDSAAVRQAERSLQVAKAALLTARAAALLNGEER